MQSLKGNCVSRIIYADFLISLSQTIEEKVVYKPDPENKNQTLCERQAWVVSNLFGFSYALQTFGVERFKKNAHKAVNGFEVSESYGLSLKS